MKYTKSSVVIPSQLRGCECCVSEAHALLEKAWRPIPPCQRNGCELLRLATECVQKLGIDSWHAREVEYSNVCSSCELLQTQNTAHVIFLASDNQLRDTSATALSSFRIPHSLNPRSFRQPRRRAATPAESRRSQPSKSTI